MTFTIEKKIYRYKIMEGVRIVKNSSMKSLKLFFGIILFLSFMFVYHKIIVLTIKCPENKDNEINIHVGNAFPRYEQNFLNSQKKPGAIYAANSKLNPATQKGSGERKQNSVQIIPEATDNVCHKQKNIVFVKTHKTASTAIQNLLFRFGEKHNLTFGMPQKGRGNQLVRLGHKFVRDAARPASLNGENKQINLLAFHGRANFEEYPHTMPMDTKYITILRRPNEVSESIVFYLGYHRSAQLQIGYGEFMKSLNGKIVEKFEKRVKNEKYRTLLRLADPNGDDKLDVSLGHYMWNPQLFDLGFDHETFVNRSEQNTQKKIDYLIKKLDFVLIAEMMDESLILLKDLFCWDWNDIITLKKNDRPTESKHTEYLEDPEVQEAVKWWNYGDQMLYEYFVEELKSKIQAYGIEKMEKDVERLKKERQKISDECLISVDPKNQDAIKDKNLVIKHNKVNVYDIREDKKDNVTCYQLALPEGKYLKRLNHILKF